MVTEEVPWIQVERFVCSTLQHFLLFCGKQTRRAKHNAAALLMDVYCVLAGEVAGGRTGWLTTVTGSELAGEAQEFRPKKIASPVGGEGVPTMPMSRAAVTVAVYCIKIKSAVCVMHILCGRGLIQSMAADGTPRT